jgi:hypothetical protein
VLVVDPRWGEPTMVISYQLEEEHLHQEWREG